MHISGLVVLGVIFVILKLAGIIETHWVFVLSPFWIGPAFLLAIYVYALIFHRKGDAP